MDLTHREPAKQRPRGGRSRGSSSGLHIKRGSFYRGSLPTVVDEITKELKAKLDRLEGKDKGSTKKLSKETTNHILISDSSSPEPTGKGKPPAKISKLKPAR